MRVIHTENLHQHNSSSSTEDLWIYNGLDCCVTYEVLEVLLPQLAPLTQATYNFSRALQGPILEMNSRGLLVDEARRLEVLSTYRADTERLASQLNRLIRDGIGWDFVITKNRKNQWPSDAQFKTLFYEVMGLPAVRKRNAEGEMTLTVDRDALEKLEGYFYAEPIIKHLLALRELGKKISFLVTATDSDSRMRTSINIAGTKTGRFASSFSEFGTGTNLQNIENRLRSIFIADSGYKYCNIDLEQSDARAVGGIHWNLFHDGRYLDLCESGDLHTGVSRLAFPTVPWTGDLILDRGIAGGKFYREFSFRDASKRLGHGTNYQGQPDKMSRATHIPIDNIKQFQKDYLTAFPSFALWWEWVEKQIRDVRKLVSLTGRQRYFMGHWKDPKTIREAIAYDPQCTTADTINRAILALWQSDLPIQLLMQVHDSVLFQFPEELEDEIVPKALALVRQPIKLRFGRELIIPGEAKVGWNWCDDPSDPDSMRKFTDAKRPATRTREPASVILDRSVP